MSEPTTTELLEQGEIWYGRTGRTLTQYKVAEMDRGYLLNLRAVLLKNAQKHQERKVNELVRDAGNDRDRLVASLDEMRMPPEAWMQARPLFRAVVARLAEIGEPVMLTKPERDALLAAVLGGAPQVEHLDSACSKLQAVDE